MSKQNSNKFVAVFTVICCLFTVLGQIGFPSKTHAATNSIPTIKTVGGYAIFEAESMFYESGIFKINNDSEAGGGKLLHVGTSEGYETTHENSARFNITIDTYGSYTVWMRVRPTTSGKTTYLSIDESPFGIIALGGTPNNYSWCSITSNKKWNAGETHSFSLIPKNGYFEIDRIIVVKDIGHIEPSGIDGIVPTNLYNAPPFTPPPEHPRLYFRKDDIPAIVANFTKTENLIAYKQHENNLKQYTNGILPEPEAGTSNTNNKYLGYFESWAFEYAINGDEKLGRQAIDSIKNYMDTVVYIDAGNDAYTRNAGHLIFTVAEVYDWCYPLLTKEDKNYLIEKSISIIRNGIEVGWPPVKQGAVTGHGSEAQTLRDMLSFAIAIYDERPDVYTLVGGRFFDEFLPARQYHYQGHFFHQGTSYGGYRGQWDYNATWIFARMGLDNVFGEDQHKAAYWFGYMLRPDSLPFSDGDLNMNGRTPDTSYTTFRRALFLAANYYKDPYLKYMATQCGLRLIGYGHGSTSPVEFLLFNDPSLETKPLSSLPLAKYFPSPAGNMVTRTGWDTGVSSNVAAAYMKIGEQWFANHHHLDFGHFQLYYKGILASDSGRYESYGTTHDYTYNKRTIAHNTILVDDPNEVVKYYGKINDHGQRIPGGEKSKIEDLLSSNYKFGKVEGHQFGPDATDPDYTYLSGDLTNAYTSKVSDFDRSFMFYNLRDDEHPAALIVFDRVITSNPEFKKTWLLHGVAKPEVDGNRTVFRNYSEAMGYNGKLTLDTLLPKADNTTIDVVGGLNNEFYVNGINYPSTNRQGEQTAPLNPDSSHESDGYRIELSPKTASATDYFLNVMQVGTSVPDTVPLEVELIETNTHAGAKIADRICLFSKADGKTSTNIYFTLDADEGETFTINVADVAAGVWNIIKNGSRVDRVTATEEGGIITFEGGAGSYTLTCSGTYLNLSLPLETTSINKKTNADGSVSVNAAVKGTGTDAVVMLGIYDKNKKMLYLDEVSYTGGKTYTFTLPSDTDYSGCEARVMVWNGLYDVLPLSAIKMITL